MARSSCATPTASQGSTIPRRRSRENDAPHEPSGQPATTDEPPTKKRKKKVKTVYDMTVEEVWEMDDRVIVDAALARWTSDVYTHFDISIARQERGRNKQMFYVFKCKYDDPKHPTTERDRLKTALGTTNMRAPVDACKARHPEEEETALKTSPGIAPYTEARHRAVVAMQCAHSKRPFNLVTDRFYREEVQLLRPGTVLPSPSTVQRDVIRLKEAFKPLLTRYFKTRNRPFHAVIDGWTSPIHEANLGVVLIWDDKGKLYRTILEFIRLTKSHTGKYLAQKLYDCLRKFDISHWLFLLGMDNASNCNTTATELQLLLPTFSGSRSRLRCFLHIIQIAAKMVISMFKKQYKRKKKIKGAQTPAGDVSVTEVTVCDGEEPADAEEEELAELANEEAQAAEAVAEKDGTASSLEAQKVHDDEVISTIRGKALAEMRARGVIVTEAARTSALKIFPKIAGLAKKVDDSPTVRAEFTRIVKETAAEDLDADTRALARECPTRWGSEYMCLFTHFQLQVPVKVLTKSAELKLKAFALTGPQWKLAKNAADILSCFERMRLMFSQGDVPLIIEVIPEMERIQKLLESISHDHTLEPVCRVAAHAGLLVCEKYYRIIDDCDAYAIAIVMCPDKKLDWFRSPDRRKKYTDDDIERIKARTVARWEESFKDRAATPPSTSANQ